MNPGFYKMFYDVLMMILAILFFIGSSVLFIYHGVLNTGNMITSILFLLLMIASARLFYLTLKGYQRSH